MCVAHGPKVGERPIPDPRKAKDLNSPVLCSEGDSVDGVTPLSRGGYLVGRAAQVNGTKESM